MIGVHTPEFSFERDLDNIRRVLGELSVGHPLAIDNAYAIWEAFANHYWPALYFIGADGRIDQRMYQLIRQQGPIVDRRFEIEFDDRGPDHSPSPSADANGRMQAAAHPRPSVGWVGRGHLG